MLFFMRIKSLPQDDQPRLKSIQNGIRSLSDSDLLAILIGNGVQQKNAKEIGQEILTNHSNNLNTLFKSDAARLEKFDGIGPAKSTILLAAFELGRRHSAENPHSSFKVANSKDVYSYIKRHLSLLQHEEFILLLMNNNNEVIYGKSISRGGLTATIADGRVIFGLAFTHKATGIILCHNHPSGNLKPSKSDILLTQKLLKFGKFIELPILDHLIFTDYGYFSFADEGLLDL
ncbi:MAG: DNA repair protein RadC [Flavobacteriia bacterium]|nr:DNA repair protein RadC [Flavobacteriia bacterium]